tara:strand:+ start:3625 stop:4155 length:531 start_codon:yes stop_codon:yes gene_type:complete
MEKSREYAIEVRGLTKQFGDFKAVNKIDLNIEKGMVYGFLGPNGAGKTTTVRMLATLLEIDGGTATIFGYDVQTEPKKIRPRIALTGQYSSVDEDLTGKENLVMICRLMGFSRKESKQRALDLLEAFGLFDAANKQTNQALLKRWAFLSFSIQLLESFRKYTCENRQMTITFGGTK